MEKVAVVYAKFIKKKVRQQKVKINLARIRLEFKNINRPLKRVTLSYYSYRDLYSGKRYSYIKDLIIYKRGYIYMAIFVDDNFRHINTSPSTDRVTITVKTVASILVTIPVLAIRTR